jgi:RNA polymerase sigma-32 factor
MEKSDGDRRILIWLEPGDSVMSISARVQQLITAARRAPQLGAEEELAFVEAWQERQDRRAADRITEANMRHVVFLAMKFRNYGVPLEDLISDGSEGLVKALQRFDRRKGVRFATYAAYWIRAHVVQSVMSGWRLDSGPRGALHSRMFFRLRRERAKWLSANGNDGLTPALAGQFGVSEERMNEMLCQIDHRGTSLDAPQPGTTLTLLEQLRGGSDQEQELMGEQARRVLDEAVQGARAMLDARERYILEHRILADPEERASLAELGARFAVSRERVRQLEVRARTKLKHYALTATIAGEYHHRAA